jgi:pyruvate dehydrogenase E2 component (dihydrolipoamide acetyltransferase)
MAYVFNFPDVGEGIHEGQVVEWLVAEGDAVDEDQPLLKVETDKAVVELPSPTAGTVLKLHVAADTTILVGEALVTIGAAGERVPEETEPAVSAEQTIEADRAAAAAATPAGVAVRRPLATPRTRARARKLGVNLQGLEGTGAGGRITDEDVERVARQGSSAAVAAKPDRVQAPAPAAASPVTAGAVVGTDEGEVERIPLSHLRKVIAGAMHSSKQTSAHVTHVDEADVTELVAHYKRSKATIEDRYGVKFSLLPMFMKALVAVLKQYPAFNASVDEEAGEMVLKRYFNIGIAVDTPEGLIVPVVRNVDQKDMITLAREVADLAERARSRQLKLSELRGGSFTITNIGPLGGVFATPIINQPELAILGLHAIKERPMVVDGEIAIRNMMYLSVSFDHRWIDGAEAARFMTDLVRLVSAPGLLMARL